VTNLFPTSAKQRADEARQLIDAANRLRSTAAFQS
jgi:hypothetical protein